MGAKVGTVSIPNVQIDTTQLRQFVFGARPQRTLCRVLIWAVLTIAFFHNLLVPIQIIGSSMSPTYHNGSLNLVNRLSYSKRSPVRGDVVAVRADGELLLKRVVALPGEVIGIQRGHLHINNKPVVDEFSFERIPWEMDPIKLEQNEYFVIGDNRAASIFCKVPKSDILGKTIF
jgi:signal peptidase I